jgi:hypothetical protein
MWIVPLSILMHLLKRVKKMTMSFLFSYSLITQYKIKKMLTTVFQIKYNIKVNNFESNSTFLKHPNYFADPFHSNEEDANFYTSDYVV